MQDSTCEDLTVNKQHRADKAAELLQLRLSIHLLHATCQPNQHGTCSDDQLVCIASNRICSWSNVIWSAKTHYIKPNLYWGYGNKSHGSSALHTQLNLLHFSLFLSSILPSPMITSASGKSFDQVDAGQRRLEGNSEVGWKGEALSTLIPMGPHWVESPFPYP